MLFLHELRNEFADVLVTLLRVENVFLIECRVRAEGRPGQCGERKAADP